MSRSNNHISEKILVNLTKNGKNDFSGNCCLQPTTYNLQPTTYNLQPTTYNLFLIKIIALTAIFILFSSAMSLAQGTEVISNGGFENGLNDWNISPDIDSTWNPLQDGAVDLNPPGGIWEDYTGTVLYQNLNVEGIGGNTFTFSMDLYQNNAGEGRTIHVELVYVTNQDHIKYLEVASPANADISADPANPTQLEQQITFPAEARKLVKIQIKKEDYGGFIADNISLTATESVSIGNIPVIYELSSYEGPYGTNISITGNHFGTEQGFVSLGGRSDGENIQSWSDGVKIQSWSDTSIEVTIQDPAQSGLIYIISDYVESNIRYSFHVTSPYYTVDLVKDELKVIKGQEAELLISTAFHNNFIPSGVISFSIDQNTLPTGATTYFTPATLDGPGGALLKIDTTGIAPGEYIISFQAKEDTSQPRIVFFKLEVLTIENIKFINPDTEEELDSLQIARQGEFNSYDQNFSIKAIDNKGHTWAPLGSMGTVEGSPLKISGDSEIVEVLPTNYDYQYLALSEGNGSVQVDAADGTSAQLPVTVDIPEAEAYIEEIYVTPERINPNYEGSLTFFARANQPLTGIGFSIADIVSLNSTFMDNSTYSDDSKSVTSTFWLKK